MTPRVAIADDHVILLEGLTGLLQSAPAVEFIGQASDGDEMLTLIRELKPDVAVVDVSMPTFGAEHIARVLAEEASSTRVVALTGHEETEIVWPILDAGVLGYVLKKSAFDDLLTAILSAAGGQRFISPSVATRLLETPRPQVTLSRRERDVLVGLASGRAYKQIASDLDISIKTVETYRARLLKKLGLSTTAELIRYAVERGLLKS